MRTGLVDRRWLCLTAVVAVAAFIVAGCGAGNDSASKTGSRATATAAAVLSASGTCADDLDSGSFPILACRWIANGDSGVCDLMTEALLNELWGGSRDGCRQAVSRVVPVKDAGAVTLSNVNETGDQGSLTLRDGGHQPIVEYAMAFVKDGPTWRIDTIEQKPVEPSGSTATSAHETDPVAAQKIKNIVLQWYAGVDPGVCDLMTEPMLKYGWEKTGDAGLAACRKNIAAAKPVKNVKVREPLINGGKAKVSVVYTLDGARQIDQIRFLYQNGQWMIDGVKLKGFAP